MIITRVNVPVQVREAFSGMNETLDSGKQRESFMKNNKTPTDIMNIMDITMRRLVKMSKKVHFSLFFLLNLSHFDDSLRGIFHLQISLFQLPAFNELSNEGKFALLKGGMVEMLTVRGVTRYDASSNSWKTPVVPDQYNVPVSMFDQLNMDCRDEQKHRFMQ